MKKIFWSLLAFATLTVACSKEIDVADDPATVPQEETASEDIDWSAYDADKYLVSFAGELEETKVSVDLTSGAVTWEDGDKVLVYVAETGASGQYQYKATDGKFYPASEADILEAAAGQNVYAYYPYSEELTPSATGAALTLPAELFDAKKAPMAGTAVIAEGQTELKVPFKNLGAILHVTLKGSETVTEVELSNTSVPLAGPATITWTDGIPALAASGEVKAIKVTETRHLSAEGTEYSFLLPPSETDMEGLALKLTYGKTVGEVTYLPYETRTRSAAFSCKRNDLHHLTFNVGFFSGGDGSEQYPYEIATAEDFKNIAAYVADETAGGPLGFVADNGTFFGSAGVHYLQTADIDIENATITPVGNANKHFQGAYDGGDKRLQNFVISAAQTQYIGLFAYPLNATFENMHIQGADVVGAAYVGALAGFGDGVTIKNVIVEGSVKSDGGATAGIIGDIKGTTTITGCRVRNLTVSANTEATGNNYGGIVGYIASGKVTISDCHTEKTCTIGNNGGKGQVGGIVGRSNISKIDDGLIENCSNEGTITSGTGGSAGGIIGVLGNGIVTKCTNKGDVNTKAQYTAGIAGQITNGGEVNSCWSDATITGANRTGGIAGYISFGAVRLCYAKGSVSGAQHVGGVVGQAYASAQNKRVLIMECLSRADVTSSTGPNSNSGGVIGRLGGNKYGTDNTVEYATAAQCVGWKANVKNTAADKCNRFGAFIGFMNTEQTGVASNNRVRIFNSYTTLEDSDLSWAATGEVIKTGGFIGELQRGNFNKCYYQISNNTQVATAATNNVWLTAFERVESDFANYLMANLGTTGNQNISNGKTYSGSAWTMTGAKGETLPYPLPSALVALGAEYYQ